MATNVPFSQAEDIPRLKGILDDVLAWLANLVVAISNYFVNLFASIANIIGNFISAIVSSLANFVSSLLAQIQAVINSLLTGINRIVQTIADFLTGALDRIIQAVTGAVNAFVALIRDIKDRLLALLGSVVDAVIGLVSSAISVIVDFIGGVLSEVTDLARTIRDEILSWLGEIASFVDGLLSGIIDGIRAAFDALITGADAVLTALIARIQEIGATLQEGIDGLIQGLQEQVGEKLDAIGEVVGEVGDFFTATGSTQGIEELVQALSGAMGGGSLFLMDRDTALNFVRTIAPTNRFQSYVFYAALSFWLSITVYKGIAEANAELILQEYSRAHAYRLLSPADAATARRRGLIDDATLAHHMGSAGFAPEAQTTMYNLTRQPAPVGDLLAMWNRGILDTDRVNDELRMHGLSEDTIAALYQAARILPPLQDIITMAVRDVFDPGAVAAGDLFGEFPEQVSAFASQQGLSAEWAQRYWGAHWRLPSEQMALEMFQRRIITFEQLNQLLKAQDIAPGWRAKITELAYNPLTRVDIRRMFEVGILNEEEVVEAHLDLGYSPDRAQQLTAFVKRLAQGPQLDDEEELGRLTRASIVGFYRDGVLDRARATRLLTGIGLSPAAAALHLDAVDADVERAERKDQVDALIDSAGVGLISFDAAQDRLNEIGLSTLEVQRAIGRLQRILERRTKLPSRQEAQAMFTAGVISEEEFRDLLARIGYAQRWVDAFVLLARRGGDSA